jgi:mannose-6-phosphate isomerase-like protein (cupin superfamily)
MAKAGDVFTLHDGEKVTVRIAAADSRGELLEVEAEWASTEHRPPAHYHPNQDERFEVLEGELSADIDGHGSVLRAGESLEVPRGVVHKMWNGGTSTVRASWQVRPALRTEDFFAKVAELRAAGRHDDHGMLTPLGGAFVVNQFRDEMRLALPSIVQRPLLAAIAGIARLRGYS